MPLSGSQTAVFWPADVWIARARPKNVILRTPLLFSPALSQGTGCQIFPRWIAGHSDSFDAEDIAEKEGKVPANCLGKHPISR
jgi:hypothetical protein